MKHFYIDNVKFNYTIEFDTQNPSDNWKNTIPLIEYFENLGITIPHYCYHKDLSIAGNCRMCLVEVKKSPKPVVSCAMNAKSTLSSEAVVFTNSPLVKKARENIMEFLLLNHPLDCPICDQGGECDLQDQSLFFGITKKRFYNFKRIVTDKNIGSIVKTVMTRCIHCTRCVRFATEIAGIEDLGTFGRGVETEIGTYVKKIFKSELSGNIIDICPVGALTSKPYPFVGRSWELKKLNSIDSMDGFGLNIQVFLKNNLIVKILPGFNKENTDTNMQWISDKTRFAFDGMNTHTRNVNKFILNNENKKEISSWKDVFKKIILTIYLFDHLEKHCLKINPFLLVFEETVSLEILSILILLEKKYSFFNVRKSSNFLKTTDFEQDLKLNTAANSNKLQLSNSCLLIGTNPRYESPYLNLKLKKRFLKGNFNVYSFNSQKDLTFPITFLGSNFKKVKKIIEGNNFLCETFKKSKKLTTIINDNLLNRKDSKTIINLINKLDYFCSKNNWNSYNLLNNSLNSVGVNSLNNFKKFTKKDFNNSCGMFFINTGEKLTKSLNKVIELNLLKYIIIDQIYNIILIDQNNKNSLINFKKNLNFFNYLYLPNNNFFETFGSYTNTEGSTKYSTKLVTSMKNTKDDWQLLRKLLSSLKNIEFTTNNKYNNIIVYNCKSLFNFRNLTNFLYLNTKSLSKISFYLNSKSQNYKLTNKNKNIQKLKLFVTQITNWIEDFYLGGFDNYCKDSEIMIKCSLDLRKYTSTFFY